MAETLDYIQALQHAIRKAHGCRSLHVASVPVKEVFQGKTMWDGTVEVFDLIGHAKAEVCYGWGHTAENEANKVRFVTVLCVPPVNTPQKAVQAVILNELRERE